MSGGLYKCYGLPLTPLGVVSDFVSLHGSIVAGRDYMSVITVIPSGMVSDLVSSQVV